MFKNLTENPEIFIGLWATSHQKIMKNLYALAFLLIASFAQAQFEGPEEMRKQVLQILTQEAPVPIDSLSIHLPGKWEALAYREQDWAPDYIEEAVPDYYIFAAPDELVMRLFDPMAPSEYAPDVEATYKLDGNNTAITIYLDDFSLEPFQHMEVLYCDANYLALRFDGLSLFLTRVL